MHDHRDDAAEWDAFYTSDGNGEPTWSGHPNGSLIAEVSTLRPGTALDVGCGEGADAIWLARQGWKVTAADPSRVALERAKAASVAAGVEVTWVTSGLLEMPGGTGVHDLVSAHYAALRHDQDDAAILALLGAVALGGTLLVVHHEMDAAHAAEHGFDPADHVMPADVAARLDDTWEVEVHEPRPRLGAVPAGSRRTRDLVLRARRLVTATTAEVEPERSRPHEAPASPRIRPP